MILFRWPIRRDNAKSKIWIKKLNESWGDEKKKKTRCIEGRSKLSNASLLILIPRR